MPQFIESGKYEKVMIGCERSGKNNYLWTILAFSKEEFLFILSLWHFRIIHPRIISGTLPRKTLVSFINNHATVNICLLFEIKFERTRLLIFLYKGNT